MAVDCLVPTNPREQELVDIMGDRAAYRLFMKYEKLGKERAVTKSFEELRKPALEKKRKILTGSQRVAVERIYDENNIETGHIYRSLNKDRNGQYPEITSVSRKLDESPETEYDGSDAGEGYARAGTAFHAVMEHIFKDTVEDVEEARLNLQKIIDDNEIPMAFVSSLQTLKERLSQDGSTFITEVLVEDIDNDIAGTVDLVHIKDNGTIDIYDLKTAFYTKSMAESDRDTPWDPTAHEGYKSRRYNAQVEFYARMIENMTGMPVSNKYILPVEVYNEDNTLNTAYSKANILPPENVDNHENWSWNQRARRMVDKHFGTDITTEKPTVTNPQGVNSVVTSVVGTYDNDTIAPDKLAEDKMLRGVKTIKGIKFYINNLKKKLVRFKNQNDPEAQKNQIIEEETSKSVKYKRDIAESVYNYFETGEDKYLKSQKSKFDTTALKKILDNYMIEGNLMEGTEVYALDSIEGFADKKNWVVIQRGDQMDLIYIGDTPISQKIKIQDKRRSMSRALFGDSLFGRYFSSGEANYLLKSNLKNNFGDAKKLEGALIMLELKANNEKLRFGNAMITSIGAASHKATHIDLENILPVIKNLITSKKREVRDIIPTHMQTYVQDNKLFDWKQYRPDLLKQYTEFIKMSKAIRDDNTLKGIRDYYKDKINKQQLDAIILRQIKDLNNRDAEGDARRQLQMLSNMHAELNGMNIYNVEPIKMTKKFISMPTNINNAVIQHVVQNVRTALSSISRDFFGYKPEAKKAIKKLFKDQRTVLGGISDITLGDTSKYYDGLFKKVSVANGDNVKQVNSFELIDEGTDEFARLTQAQQEFITFFNDTIEKYVEKIQLTTDSSFKWKRGRVPLLRASFANKLFNIYSNPDTDQSYKELSAELFENVEEGFTFDEEHEPASSDISDLPQNPFLWQTNDEFSPGDWNTKRGLVLTEDGNYSYDPTEDYNRWSTNLEIIADMFVIHAIRVEKFNTIMPTVAAAENMLNWQKSNLFEERLGSAINWLEVWKQGTIDNKSQDAGSSLDKVTRSLNKMASVALIGFRPQTALFATMAQEVTAFSQAIAQSLSGSQSFGVGDFIKAGAEVWNPKNIHPSGRQMIDELLSEYRMFNNDFSSVMSGYHRYGNTSIFKTRFAFGLLNMGDWATRSQVLVAQMMKDGVWEAYSMDEDGNLVYDETKDKRFQGENGKLLKETLKKSLAEEDGLNPDGTMRRAYDSRQSESMKFEADSIVGGFDRETRGLYNYWALGKLLGLFKTWLPARLNKGFDSQFINEVAGDYEIVEDSDGEKQFVWKGKQMEGIMFSMLHVAFNLKQMLAKAEKAEMNQNQKENLMRAMGDTMFISLAFLSSTAIAEALGDDDKNILTQELLRVISRSTDDLVSTYNVLALVTDMGTPISIGYTLDLLKNIWNALAAIPNPNDSSLDYITDNMTITRDIHNMLQGD